MHILLCNSTDYRAKRGENLFSQINVIFPIRISENLDSSIDLRQKQNRKIASSSLAFSNYVAR